MGLSDSQMMLLEQMTYAGDVFDALGIHPDNNQMIYDTLIHLSDDEINSLRGNDKVEGTMSGDEWADILLGLKNDPELCNLTCEGYDAQSKAYCFTDKDGGVYVAFKGTDGSEEWIDDALGLYMSDTPYQKYALDYIEGLPYDHIKVVGHSKGGNKAQYVALLSDKVDGCVSMDGQGFSKEFIDKYWAEIEKNACKLKCYSYSDDFVHILLNYVPGVDPIFCSGTNTGANCHNPNAFITIDPETGKVTYKEVPENPSMTYLHRFTCFAANNMSVSDREKVGWYIGVILALARIPQYSITINGITYTNDNMMDFIALDPDAASTVLAWLMNYINVYNLSKEEVVSLCRMLGFGDKADLVWFIAEHINVNDDPASIMGLIKTIMDLPGVDAGAWETIVKQSLTKYSDIKTGKNVSRSDYHSRTGKNRDFSQNSLNRINSTIDTINSLTYDDTASWSAYSGEEWYGFINAGIAKKGISNYYSKLYLINGQAKSAIGSVYQAVYSWDNTYSRMMLVELGNLNGYQSNLIDLINNIGQ